MSDFMEGRRAEAASRKHKRNTAPPKPPKTPPPGSDDPDLDDPDARERILKLRPDEVVQDLPKPIASTAHRYPMPMRGEAWNDPHRLARLFLDEHRTPDGLPTLLQWRGEYHRWNGSAWLPVADADLDADLARHCRDVFVSDYPLRVEQAQFAADAEGEVIDRKPTLFTVTSTVRSNVRTNLAGLTNVPDDGRDPPFWLLDAANRPQAHVVIAAPNGLFRLEDIAGCGKPFSPPTPTFFTPNALPFAVEPDAPRPATWLRCIQEWFAGDDASVSGLQEWFGYLLTADTSAHKILMLCGPPRAGKGVILNTLTELAGAGNVASTSFAALSENFGLEALIGKRIAVIPDARLSGRTDAPAVVERLLSVSGEDSQTINRKHRTRVTSRLPVRFVLASNEIPRLPDASGALASRFHILRTPNSWLGKEDRGLKGKLAAELPGILQWAAAGWVRLRMQGMAFTQKDAAAEYQRELEDLSSPIRAFVRECCEVGPECEVEIASLYQAWRDWNESKHREVGSEQMFGRDLRSALPQLRTVRTNRAGESRTRVYIGVRLKPRLDWGDENP